MTELDHYILKRMGRSFKYGENDCVLFTGLFFQKRGVPVFKVIEDGIKVTRKNWPKSFAELEAVAKKFSFASVSEMHISLVKKMGFKVTNDPKDGDLVLDTKRHTLGLGWRGGAAFVSDDGVVVMVNQNFKRWSF